MKKCKCLKCGGIYDLPQPKSCPACGGIKFQPYFIKGAPPVRPAPKPAVLSAPLRPMVRSTAKPTAPSLPRPVAKPTAKPVVPSSFKTGKSHAPISHRIKKFCTWVIGESWNQRVERICRIGGLLIAAAIFAGTFFIPWMMFGGWCWGVIAFFAMIFFVKR